MRVFSLGQVLTITTGKMLCRQGVGGIYEILNYMTNDNLFTHQLPRAINECAPYLLKQFPQLAGVDASPVKDEVSLERWLADVMARFGETLEVEPIPQDDHTYRDPVEELREMTNEPPRG